MTPHHTASKKPTLLLICHNYLSIYLFYYDHKASWALGPYFDYASSKLFYEFLLDFKK